MVLEPPGLYFERKQVDGGGKKITLLSMQRGRAACSFPTNSGYGGPFGSQRWGIMGDQNGGKQKRTGSAFPFVPFPMGLSHGRAFPRAQRGWGQAIRQATFGRSATIGGKIPAFVKDMGKKGPPLRAKSPGSDGSRKLHGRQNGYFADGILHRWQQQQGAHGDGPTGWGGGAPLIENKKNQKPGHRVPDCGKGNRWRAH